MTQSRQAHRVRWRRRATISATRLSISGNTVVVGADDATVGTKRARGRPTCSLSPPPVGRTRRKPESCPLDKRATISATRSRSDGNTRGGRGILGQRSAASSERGRPTRFTKPGFRLGEHDSDSQAHRRPMAR